MFYKAVLASVFGYLIGSVPWALVIGKLFYKTDIREHGSGNLGATNAGRVLGLPAFLAVSLLDGLKGFIVFTALKDYDLNLALIGCLAVVIGHCYPLFAQFKGGKGVATSLGVLLAIGLTGDAKYLLLQFVLPLVVMLLVLWIFRHMSLGSMIGLVTSVVVAWIYNESTAVKLCLTLLCIVVIIKHKDNIHRLINHEESVLY